MLKKRKTGSMVCPSCGKLISVNATECIHCGRKQPGLWGYGPALQQFFGSGMNFVAITTLFCIVLYIVSLLLDVSKLLEIRGLFDILAPSPYSLFALGATGKIPLASGRWWTVVTAIYLHGNLLHIIFNLLWFRQLGSYVESFYGNSRLIIIFTFSGVLGFILSNTLGIPFTIGASGSVFGLLGALIHYGRTRGGEFGAAIYRQVGSWAIIMFLFGFVMSGINNWAHLGGFIGGYLSSMLVGFSEQRRENQIHHTAAVICIVLTLAAFALSIFGFIFHFQGGR